METGVRFEVCEREICENSVFYGQIVASGNNESLLCTDMKFDKEDILNDIERLKTMPDHLDCRIEKLQDGQFRLFVCGFGSVVSWRSEKYTQHHNARKALGRLFIADLEAAEIIEKAVNNDGQESE